MDSDVLFQAQSADGHRVAVVTQLIHLDGSEEFQVDLYLGDTLGSDSTLYTQSYDEAKQMAKDLSR